jgi:hypothetical protein
MGDLSFSVDPESMRRLFATLDRVTAVATLNPPMQRSLARMQHDLQVYPAASRKPQPFKSDKQRRFVMALIREGKVPYRRTGNLGRKWTTHVSTSSNGIEGTVGNNTDYGPYVQSASGQAAYHQGTWNNTDLAVFNRNHAGIERDFLTAIERALEGR